MKTIKPMTPVMMKSVLIFSWFGEAPLSGAKVSANAGTAATRSTKAAVAAASRMTFLFERKAGRNYTVTAAKNEASGLNTR